MRTKIQNTSSYGVSHTLVNNKILIVSFPNQHRMQINKKCETVLGFITSYNRWI